MPALSSKYWRPLKVGDIVDVVAPGFATTDERLQGGVEFLKRLGLKPRVPTDLFGADPICSNTDERRLKHLQRAVKAKDSAAIWCVRGGYGAIRIIDEFAKIKPPTQPKVFIGYSDAVTLHNFMNHFWRWPTLHGPLLDRLGQHDLPLDNVNELIDVLFGARDMVEHGELLPLNSAAKKKSRVRGRTGGGNLTVTQSHLGTRFFRPAKDEIVIFEDIGERGYRVDRILTQLRMAGYFKGVRAVVFGDFIGGREPSGEALVAAAIERFAAWAKFPVLSGLAVGHGERQRVLPLFAPAVLTTGGRAQLSVETGARFK